MSTVTFVKKAPAGGLGKFNLYYKCKCSSGVNKGCHCFKC